MQPARQTPSETRQALLQAAFTEIHRKGFQAASLSHILANTSLTKGALYHHFPNKTALGYAVVDEVIKKIVIARWVQPLESGDDPIVALLDILDSARATMTPEAVLLGCPLNNLAQEMSPVDEGFRLRINRIFTLWRAGIALALMRGQAAGKVRKDIDAAETAAFIVASLEGCLGMAKNAQNPRLLFSCGKSLMQYLESLRPLSPPHSEAGR